jgi:hypothetical protein
MSVFNHTTGMNIENIYAASYGFSDLLGLCLTNEVLLYEEKWAVQIPVGTAF